MYALCQEGSVKVKADVASIGESTLRVYLHCFARAVVAVMKPVYMPVKPFAEAERDARPGPVCRAARSMGTGPRV